MTTYIVALLLVAVLALAVAVYTVYAGHNMIAKRLAHLELEQSIHAGHLRNHAKKLDNIRTPSGRIIRGPKIGSGR